MLEHGPAAGTDTQLALKCALMKDAIRMCRATSKGPAREQRGVRQLAEMLDLDDEKVRFIEDACEQDEKILRGELSDSQIAAVAKNFAARAASVSVPVAAVYLSGSVTGLSAAGIASGLAALGLGGVLGLSAMVSGIGVAIIVGGTAYKGVRFPAGATVAGRDSNPLGKRAFPRRTAYTGYFDARSGRDPTAAPDFRPPRPVRESATRSKRDIQGRFRPASQRQPDQQTPGSLREAEPDGPSIAGPRVEQDRVGDGVLDRVKGPVLRLELHGFLRADLGDVQDPLRRQVALCIVDP